ncbi:MAG: hypothetical protein AAF913_07065 [Pseudomonadota bacterium]
MEIRLDALPSDPTAVQTMIRALSTELHSRDILIDRPATLLAKPHRSQIGRLSEKLKFALKDADPASTPCRTGAVPLGHQTQARAPTAAGPSAARSVPAGGGEHVPRLRGQRSAQARPGR